MTVIDGGKDKSAKSKADPKDLAEKIVKDFDNAGETFAQYRLWNEIDKFNKNPELRKQTIEELKARGLNASYEKQRNSSEHSSSDIMVISISKQVDGKNSTVRFSDIQHARGSYRRTEVSEDRYPDYGAGSPNQLRQAFEHFVRENEKGTQKGVFDLANSLIDLNPSSLQSQLQNSKIGEAAKLLNKFFGQEVLSIKDGKDKTITVKLDDNNYITYDASKIRESKYSGKDISSDSFFSSNYLARAEFAEKLKDSTYRRLALDPNSAAGKLESRLAQIKEQFGAELVKQITRPTGWENVLTATRTRSEIEKEARQIADDVCKASDPFAVGRLKQASRQLNDSFGMRMDILPKLNELGASTKFAADGFTATKECSEGARTVNLGNPNLGRSYRSRQEAGDFRDTETVKSKTMAALQLDMRLNQDLNPDSQKLVLSLATLLLPDPERSFHIGSEAENTIKSLLNLPRKDAEEIVGYLNKAFETKLLSIAENTEPTQLVLAGDSTSSIVWNQEGKIDHASFADRATKDTSYLFNSTKTQENAELAEKVLRQTQTKIVHDLSYSESSIVSNLDARRQELTAKWQPVLEKSIPTADEIQNAFAKANIESEKLSAHEAEQIRKSIINHEIHALAAGLKSEAEMNTPSLMSFYASILSAPELDYMQSKYESDKKLTEDMNSHLKNDYWGGKKIVELERLHKRLLGDPSPELKEFFSPNTADFRTTETARGRFSEAIKADMKANTDLSMGGQRLASSLLEQLVSDKSPSWTPRNAWEDSIHSTVKYLLRPPLGTAAEVLGYLNKVTGKETFVMDQDSSGKPQLTLKEGNSQIVWSYDGSVKSATMDASKKESMFSSLFGESALITAETVRKKVAFSILDGQARSSESATKRLERKREELAASMLPELDKTLPSIETIQKEFEIANNNEKISRQDAEHLRKTIMNYAVYLAAAGAKPATLEKSPTAAYSFATVLTYEQVNYWQAYSERYAVNAKDMSERFKLSAEQAERADKLERLHKRLFPRKH